MSHSSIYDRIPTKEIMAKENILTRLEMQAWRLIQDQTMVKIFYEESAGKQQHIVGTIHKYTPPEGHCGRGEVTISCSDGQYPIWTTDILSIDRLTSTV